MKVQFYRPRNKILQKHIKGYYFISENEASAPINYLTFPTNYCILSTSYNSDVFFEMNKIIVLPSSQEEINTDLVFRFTKPIEVYYENPINEITIYFKPLGLNNYVNNLNELFTKRKNVEDYNPFPDFKEKMNVIFKIKNRDQQIEELENYWISKLQIEDLSLMELILSDLTADFKINDIAKKHNLTRQYLTKFFITNIGKTPTEYRKIYRFRISIRKKKNAKNLTALSYENLFFDQSHFIKNFKELSNNKPSLFFKNVDIEKGNIWLFI